MAGNKTVTSIKTLLNSAIDYAGLFPPAGLAMQTAVEHYAAHRKGDHSWALGRFVVPASRLHEMNSCVEALPCDHDDGNSWPLSVLVDVDSKLDFQQLMDVKRRFPSYRFDSVELKARSREQIEHAIKIYSFSRIIFEISVNENTTALLDSIARMRSWAKVRTGGVEEMMIPSPAQLAQFIVSCAHARVPFKATAGLHHAVRSLHPLTQDPSSPLATMHGFLNVLMASAAAFDGACESAVAQILQEEDPGAFIFEDAAVSWGDYRLAESRLKEARDAFFMSFGSCSFQAPISELRALALL